MTFIDPQALAQRQAEADAARRRAEEQARKAAEAKAAKAREAALEKQRAAAKLNDEFSTGAGRRMADKVTGRATPPAYATAAGPLALGPTPTPSPSSPQPSSSAGPGAPSSSGPTAPTPSPSPGSAPQPPLMIPDLEAAPHSWPAYGTEVAGSERAAEAMQNRPSSKAIAKVDDAYQRGGPDAAAAELRKQTVGLEPQLASEILVRGRAFIDRIAADDGLSKQGARDLAIAVSSTKGAPAHDEVVKLVSTSIQRHMSNALSDVIDGHDRTLIGAMKGFAPDVTDQMVSELNGSGRTQKAFCVTSTATDGVAQLQGEFEGLAKKVQGADQLLAGLQADWGKVLTPAQLKKATEAFIKSHPEYAEFDKVSARLVDAAGVLPKGSIKPEDLKTALTEGNGGAEALAAQAQKAEDSGAPATGLLADLGAIAADVGIGADLADAAAAALLRGKISAFNKAFAAGDVAAGDKVLASLDRYKQLLGHNPQALADLRAAFVRQRSLPPGSPEFAQGETRIREALGKLDEHGTGHSRTHKALGLLSVGVTGFALTGSIAAFRKDKGAEAKAQDALGIFVAGGTAGEQLTSLASKLWTLPDPVLSGNEVAGKVFSLAGAALGVWQGIDALKAGDGTNAALSFAGSIGTLLTLGEAGLTTGVGALVVGGAAVLQLAVAQYRKVEASNVQENGHTEAFLRAAGFSPKLAYELRNADSDGRSVGPVLAALAQHLGVDPRHMVGWVNSLSQDQVHDLVAQMAGVDPNSKGEYPATADGDQDVGTTSKHAGPRGGAPGQRVDAHSLEGLRVYLERQGIPLPS